MRPYARFGRRASVGHSLTHVIAGQRTRGRGLRAFAALEGAARVPVLYRYKSELRWLERSCHRVFKPFDTLRSVVVGVDAQLLQPSSDLQRRFSRLACHGRYVAAVSAKPIAKVFR